MSVDTLKEFLVAIGFGVDEPSFNKAVAKVDDVTKAVVRHDQTVTKTSKDADKRRKDETEAETKAAGARKQAVEATTAGLEKIALTAGITAAGVTAAVFKIAGSFDNLFYSSQRTGASAEGLKALSFAMSQVGGTSEGARNSVEGFAKALRTNPGTKGLLNSLGVSTEENGKARDTVEIYKDLTKAFAGRPHYVNEKYGALLGLSEEDVRLIERGEFQAKLEEYRKAAADVGLDQEKAAKAGQEFEKSLGRLRITVTTVAEKLATDLMPAIKPFIDDFTVWVRDNHQSIQDAVIKIGNALLACGKALVGLGEALKPAWETFDRLSKRFTGQDGLTTLFEAFGLVLALKVLAPLGRILTILTALTALRMPAWLLSMAGIGGAGVAAGAAVGAATVYGAAKGAQLGLDPETGPITNELKQKRDQVEVYDQAIARHEAAGDTKAAAESKRKRDQTQGEAAELQKKLEKVESGRAAAPEAGQVDNRNFWQRHAPKALGGKDGPGKEERVGRVTETYPEGLADAIRTSAKDLGISPRDLATAISYETGGTFDPWKKGPTTQHGQHRGLIQWGEPQRKQYGVTKDSTVAEQMKAVTQYLRDRGVKPGHGLLEIYSAINAGSADKAYHNRSDAGNGGAPGTVADKVRSQMEGHKRKADALLATEKGSKSPGRTDAPEAAPLGRLAESVHKLGSTLRDGRAGEGEAITGLFDPRPLAPSQAFSSSANVTTTNTFQISGAGDPNVTAAAIAGQQDRVASRTLRNAQGAIR